MVRASQDVSRSEQRTACPESPPLTNWQFPFKLTSRDERLAFRLALALGMVLCGAWAWDAWRGEPRRQIEKFDAPAIVSTVDVNSAPSEELELLPGIGPALAQRLIADRERSGPFRDLVSLQRVRGIGPKTTMKIAPFIVFGDTPQELP